jgi:hypothetical protein
MPQGKFYNTTDEKPEKVKRYQRNALSQDQKILNIFKEFEVDQSISAWEIHGFYLTTTPITSIRRALNTLMKENKIERGPKRIGNYNRPEYVYKLIK